MRLSYKALKSWIDFTGTAQDLSNVLSELGFPNDGILHRGEGISSVLVGKILQKDKHPQADRLSLLKVSVGAETLPIVCGAQNMKTGDFVALAPVGAKIPGKDGSGLLMKEAKIRGETSMGMCCSPAELRLSEESDGIWILDPAKVNESSLGKPVSQFFDEEDWILQLDITPNRGDALSVRGLAREVAAKMGLKMKVPTSLKWKNPSSGVNPTIENFEEAYGFAACLVTGVSSGPTPASYQKFLEAAGARSILNLVDISNIVLFELGHPIHFFDADKVDAKTIGVRRARAGEKLEILSGQVLELHPEDLVIADASGPLSLAGIMGGKASSCSADTKNVLIEVASFNPARIRNSARRHQLSSESSHRFERGVLPHRLDEVMERALALTKELSGFESAAGTKVVTKTLEVPSVIWSRDRVEAKLGKLPQTDDQIFELLRRLEYGIEPKGSTARLIFPWYRSDCSCLEDAMEDLARLVGYENLEKQALRTVESVDVLPDLRKDLKISQALGERLNRRGFSQVLHMSFVDGAKEDLCASQLGSPVLLKNPIHAEKSRMRRLLLPQLFDRARFNAFNGEDEIRLFEVGPVFSKENPERGAYQNSAVQEVLTLACVWLPRASDKKHLWNHGADLFFEFKGLLEEAFGDIKIKSSGLNFDKLYHPRRRFDVGGGIAGEVHPLVQKAFDLPSRVFAGEWTIHRADFKKLAYSVPAQIPAVELDASFVLSSEISFEKVSEVLKKKSGKIVESIRIYDVFEGSSLPKGKKSFTFALRYRSAEKTLTLEEAKKEHDSLVKAVISAFPEGHVALR